MRLLRLETSTQRWVIEEFPARVPFYAILSHVWGPASDEVTFEDISTGTRRYDDNSKPGFAKLRFCHRKAVKDGLTYFWIDTCCIKKTDSTELLHSLNSMYYWYQRAATCYVLLWDVSYDDATTSSTAWKWKKALSKSRWFTRGWTLQELLAPKSVAFFTGDSRYIGSKNDDVFIEVLSSVTHIPVLALRGANLGSFSTDTRLSWAGQRRLTVPEDSAYCLSGIFEVQLPWLYADGDYEKRKKIALAGLMRAIKDAPATDAATKADDVLRIGGASYADLSKLDQTHLSRLDADLEGYLRWLLTGFPAPHTTVEGSMTAFSEFAGKQMKLLLSKYSVRYEDFQDSKTVVEWMQEFKNYQDQGLESRKRVRGLLRNRLYWGGRHENMYTLITALRTLEDLMVWRGKWEK